MSSELLGGSCKKEVARRTAPRRVGRRDFIQKGSVSLVGAGLAAFMSDRSAADQPGESSKIVMVKHAGATDDRGAGSADIVKQMVDRSIRELTGRDSLRDAWREFVSPDDVVGLKVNVRGGRELSTQPCVVAPIVGGLVSAGVKRNNIIIWDAWNRELARAGFTLNESDDGVRCYGTDRGKYRPGRDPGRRTEGDAWKPFYSPTPVPVEDKTVYFSRILADELTVLINVPLITDHRIAGVTVSMKNHFGSILNPSDLHPSCCDPYLAALNVTAPIKDKTRLIIVDGLRALYNGGPRDNPQWKWRQNSIIASADTVAIDHLGLQIIEEKRGENGLAPLGDRARHVATAARMGLGTNDPTRMDMREIDLGATA
jgi:uncharacterized protein (DUF362 family)